LLPFSLIVNCEFSAFTISTAYISATIGHFNHHAMLVNRKEAGVVKRKRDEGWSRNVLIPWCLTVSPLMPGRKTARRLPGVQSAISRRWAY